MQLEDIARSPAIIDPSLNSAECVVHAGKYSFKGWKKLFPHICWVVLAFSLLGSNLISVIFSEYCKDVYRRDEQLLEVKVMNGLLIFLVILCLVGITIAIAIIVIGITTGTNEEQYCYPIVHLVVIIFLILLQRFCCPPEMQSCADHCKVSKRQLLTITYLGWYIVFHHVLWIIMGIITEPFWAIPVLIFCLLVAFALNFGVLQCLLLNQKVNRQSPRKKWDKRTKGRCFLTILGVLSLFPFLFTVLLVGNQFFSETLIAAAIPSVIIVILSLWFKGLIKTKQTSSAESNATELHERKAFAMI